MKQIALLPSGCQNWNKNVFDSGGSRFAYCSTLAAYVYNIDTFSLEKLIAAHERTVTGLSWSKVNPNYFVSCGIDYKICLWNVETETKEQHASLGATPKMVDFCNHDDKNVAVLLSPGNVHLWNVDSKVTQPVKGLCPDDLTCIRWNHKQGSAPVLACGHSDGSVWFWSAETKAVTKILPAERKTPSKVIDIQWDPLSNAYIVVSYANGHLALIDVGRQQIMTDFLTQSRDVVMTAFVPSIPGGFVTVNDRGPVLTLWNVSQTNPVEHIKIGTKKCGMLAVKATSAENKFLCAFTDGAVAIFDIVSRRVEFLTEPGHSETVFDCQMKPSSANCLATASYDGCVKIWDTIRMENKLEMKGESGLLYSLSWCPGGDDEHRLVTSSSKGVITIWDSKRGTELHSMPWHSKPSFKVKWNPNDPDLIASTGSDGVIYVFTPQGRVKRKYQTTSGCAAYGCDWSPHDKDLLAVALHDGRICVYDVSQSNTLPVKDFTGHEARAFNVAWSLLVEGLLASGSDDKTVRIWDYNNPEDEPVVLKGHKTNVRALSWNYEIPYLLISGSWDGSVRVWDTRSQACLYQVNDHHADVYGMVSHPSRPFVYASTSRDTSLRFWTLDESITAVCKIRSVLDLGQLRDSSVGETKEVMEVAAQVKMCGETSKELSKAQHTELKKTKNLVKVYSNMFDYFSALPGSTDLWNLVDSIAHEKAGPTEQYLQHINDIKQVAFSKASELKSPTVIGFSRGKKETRLAQAADLYLKLGEIEKYCETCVALNQWEKALAVAPAKSLGYWKQLTQRYAHVLKQKTDLSALPYFVATGDITNSVNIQVELGEFEGAMLTAVTEASGKFPMMPDFDDENENEEPEQDGKANEREDILPTEHINRVANRLADINYRAALPVRAACCHLSIGEPMRAVEKLLLGNELSLAYALVTALELQFVDQVFFLVAAYCEGLGLWEEAMDALKQTRDPEIPMLLLASRFNGPSAQKRNFYMMAGLRSAEAFLEGAQASEGEEKLLEAAQFYLAAGAYDKAAELCFNELRDFLSRNSWSADEIHPFIDVLNSINIKKVNSSTRIELMAFSFFAAAQQAVWKGYTPLVSFLFSSVATLIEQGNIDFPVSIHAMKLQEISFFQNADLPKAMQMLNDLLSESGVNPKVKSGALAIKKTLEQALVDDDAKLTKSEWVSNNVIIPSGSNLPSGLCSKSPVVSIISNIPITGVRVQVRAQDPHLSQAAQPKYISRSEGLMLNRLTPFSPLLDGSKLFIP